MVRVRYIVNQSEADAKLLKELSLNLWRRINAGYCIYKRKLESHSHTNYKFDATKVEKANHEFFHKLDDFAVYTEAKVRFQMMLPPPPRKPPVYIPMKQKMETQAKLVAAKKTAKKVAEIKSGVRKKSTT